MTGHCARAGAGYTPNGRSISIKVILSKTCWKANGFCYGAKNCGASISTRCCNLGQLFFAREDYIRAAETYRRAIEKDEVLEAAHRELMRCYARSGERGQALRHYQTLTRIMRDELGSPPAPESVALYERLRRGETV